MKKSLVIIFFIFTAILSSCGDGKSSRGKDLFDDSDLKKTFVDIDLIVKNDKDYDDGEGLNENDCDEKSSVDEDCFAESEEKKIEGYVQKGPFSANSKIEITLFDKTVETSAKLSAGRVLDDFGSYTLKTGAADGYATVEAGGRYFNEVQGKLSEEEGKLKCLVELSSDKNVNMNVLTTLAHDRLKFLLKNYGKKFSGAREQVEREVLKIFKVDSVPELPFHKMDITGKGPANGILLAASLFLQGEGSAFDLTSLINEISKDFEEDGTVDSEWIKAFIEDNARYVCRKKKEIAAHIINFYKENGKSVEVPSITEFCSDFEDKDYSLSFIPVKEADLEKEYLSNGRTLFFRKGGDGGRAEIVEGPGKIFVNNEERGIGTDVKDGDVVRLKLRASSNFGEEKSTKVEISESGGEKRYGVFSVKTRSERYYSLIFDPVEDADIKRDYISNGRKIALPDTILELDAKITFGDGVILVNDVEKGAETKVKNGDVVKLKITTGPEYGMNRKVQVEIGNAPGLFEQGIYSVTTRKERYFHLEFEDVYNAEFNTEFTSNQQEIKLPGHAVSATAKLEDGKYGTLFVNGEERGVETEVKDGDLISVMIKSAVGYDKYKSVRVIVGFLEDQRISGYFGVKTRRSKYFSTHFSFIQDARLFKEYTSNGTTVVLPQTIPECTVKVVSDGGSIVINDEEMGVEGRVKDGDVLQLKMTTGGELNKYETAIIELLYEGSRFDNGYFSVHTTSSPFARVVSSSNFSPRMGHSSLVHRGKMWVIGGEDAEGYKNDVWYSTDGIKWNQATADAGFEGRAYHVSLVFNDSMWVIGGKAGADDSGAILFGDVWRSEDGEKWEKVADSITPLAKSGHSALILDNRIWVLGGSGINGTTDEVWSSKDGKKWINETPPRGFMARDHHTSLAFNEKVWIIGGQPRDVLYSEDFRTWNYINLSEPDYYLKEQYYHTSVVFDAKIWSIGGRYYKDVGANVKYFEEGGDWTMLGNISYRYGHSSVVFMDRIWIIGGWDGNVYLNDVHTLRKTKISLDFDEISDGEVNKKYISDERVIVLPDGCETATVRRLSEGGSIILNDELKGSEAIVNSGDSLKLEITTGGSGGQYYSAAVEVFCEDVHEIGSFAVRTKKIDF